MTLAKAPLPCSGRMRYSQEEARKAQERVRRDVGDELRVEHCEACGYWHTRKETSK